MRVKLQLKQLTGEYLQHKTATGIEIGLDISSRGFRQVGQIAFLDIRFFNPSSKLCANTELDI